MISKMPERQIVGVGYFTGKRLQDSRGDDHHRTENNRPDGHHPSPDKPPTDRITASIAAI